MQTKRRGYAGASSALGADFGIDWAKRLVKRNAAGMPVSQQELRIARELLKNTGRKNGA